MRGVTLVRDGGGVLPVDGERDDTVTVRMIDKEEERNGAGLLKPSRRRSSMRSTRNRTREFGKKFSSG